MCEPRETRTHWERVILFTQLRTFVSLRKFPGLSLTSLAAKKLGTLLMAVLDLRRFSLSSLKERARTKKQKGRFQSRPALVLAAGPSVDKVDWSLVVAARRAHEVSIITINSFVDSMLANVIEPDIVVFSDPLNRPDIDPNTVLVRTAKAWPEAKHWVPRDWSREVSKLALSDTVYYFEDQGLEGWGRTTSPLKLRRYQGLTAHKALAIADFLGFAPIGLVGMDATPHLGAQVGPENQLFFDSHHHAGYPGGSIAPLPHLSSYGPSDLYWNLAMGHHLLARCFSDKPVWTIGFEGQVTAFPRISFQDFADRFLINPRG